MKLSDLPRAADPIANGVEVIVQQHCPAGRAYLFEDGKMIVRALDDEITEIKCVPGPLSGFLRGLWADVRLRVEIVP